MADSIIIKIDGDTKPIEKEISSLETDSKGSFNKIASAINTVSTALSNQEKKVSELATNVKSGTDKISTSFDSVRTKVTSVFDPVSQAVSQVSTEFNSLTSTVKSLGDKLVEPFKKADEEITSLKTWEEYAKDSGQSFSEIEKEVKALSSTFEREGYSQKEALEKAYEQIGIISKEEMKKAENAMEEAEDQAKSSANNMEKHYKTAFSSVGTTISSALGKFNSFSLGVGKSIGTVVGLAATGVASLAAIGTAYNTQIETYETNFEVMLGSAEEAQKKVEELAKMGASTPFELPDLASATEQLLAFGVASEDTQGYLQQLGDISLGNVDKLNTLTNAFGKMNSSGKVTLETINMMSEQGFNPLQEISRTTGESMESLYDRVSKGSVSLDEITNAFETATEAGGTFYKGMEKASQTTEGLLSTLKDNFQALVGEVFMPLSDQIQQVLLPLGIESIQTLSTAFKEGGVSAFATALGDVLSQSITMIVQNAPTLIELAFNLLTGLANSLLANSSILVNGFTTILYALVEGVQTFIPVLNEFAFMLIPLIAQAIIMGYPLLLEVGIGILTAIITGIASSLDTLIPMAQTALESLVQAIVDNLPIILAAAIEIVLALVQFIIDNVDLLIDSALSIIDTVVNFLLANLDQILQAAIQLLVAVITGLAQALPQLASYIPQIILTIVDVLLSNLPLIINAAIEMQLAVIQGLIQAIPQLVAAIPQITGAIIQGLLEVNWGSVGYDIVRGVIGGFSGAGNIIWSAVKGVYNQIMSTFKSLFGIASPAKKMKPVGRDITRGVAVGEEEATDEITDVIDNQKGEIEKAYNKFDFSDVQITPDDYRQQLMSSMSGINVNPTQNLNSMADIKTPTNVSTTTTTTTREVGEIVVKADVIMDGRVVGELVAPTVNTELANNEEYEDKGGF